MSVSIGERHRLALLAWVATVAMSLSMFPALQEKRFFLIGAALSAGVVAVGMVARQFRVPSPVVFLLQLALIVEVIGVGFGGETVAGVLPTSASYAHVHDLVETGIQIAQTFAAPAPHSTGLTLVVVAFIATVMAIVDFLAIGIGRVPLAGLPLLVLYTVPVAILPSGLPMLCFLPGAVGYVALLLVAERDRVAHWGRHVARTGAEPIDTSALSANGRRISLVALVLAVGLPMLVPGFSNALFATGRGIGSGPGSNLSFSDPMVSLAQDLQRSSAVDLLTVSSPDEVPRYLRLTVLNQPTPSGWRAAPINLSATTDVSNVFPPPTGLSGHVATVAHTMTITPTDSYPTDSLWLPVPYDLMTFSARNSVADLGPGFAYVPGDQTIAARNTGVIGQLTSYRLEYGVPDPTGSQLTSASPAPANIVRQYEGVPVGVPSVVGEIARQVTRGATSDYQRALMLQSYFRDSSIFTYDLDVSYGDGYQAMAKFLHDHRGYCQHFAATMAMMARTLGIPSRVVVGFLHPDKLASGGYVFTSHDAHAWPELYFSGVGWVRFEPTPGNGATPPPWAPKVAIPPVIGGGGPKTTPGPTVGHVTGLPTTAVKPPVKKHHAVASPGSLPSRWWLLVVVAVVVLFTPALLRIGVRRSRRGRGIDAREAAENAWLELRDGLRDLGLPWSGSMSPRARLRLLEPMLGGDPESVAALRRLALAVERARYAATVLPGSAPADDARTVVRVIGRAIGPAARIRAVLLPPSLLSGLGGWLSRGRGRVRRTPQATQPT